MKCKKIGILISAAMDGEITEREALELEAHLAHCRECRRERDSLSAVRKTLAAWETPEPAESLANSFAARLRREQDARARGARVLIFPRLGSFGWASAAAVALLAAAYVGTLRAPETPRPVKRPAVVVERPAGIKQEVTPKPPERIDVAVTPEPARPTHRRSAARVERVRIAVAPAEDRISTLEAERKVTEKAERLRTLIAAADYAVERALISPTSDLEEETDTISDYDTNTSSSPT